MQFIKDDETLDKIKEAVEVLYNHDLLTVIEARRIIAVSESNKVMFNWKRHAVKEDLFLTSHLQYQLTIRLMSGKYVVRLFDYRKGSIIFTGEALTFSEGEKKLIYWMDNNNVPCLYDNPDT